MKIIELLKAYPNLHSTRIVTFLTLQELWGEREAGKDMLLLQNADIEQIIHTDRRRIASHIADLSKKELIITHSISGAGIAILWVRRSPTEPTPNEWNLKRHLLGIKLLDSEGKLKVVLPGKVKAFCQKYDLCENSVHKMRRGDIQQHKGWKMAKHA